MPFLEHLLNALRSIRANKMRTALSSLGIIIGVTSVIVLMAFGEGTQRSISSNIESLGTNLLTLRPGGNRQGDVRQTNVRTSNIFTLDDEAELQKISGVAAVSPVANSSRQVIVGNANANTTVYGIGADYSKIKNIKAQYGMFIGADDVAARSKVAVLGPTTATNFFGTANPLGQDIKVGNVYLRVIGIAESKGSGSGPIQSTDDAIYVPITTMQDRFLGNKYVSQFVIMADSSDVMDSTKQAITDHYLAKFKITDTSKQNFQVQSSAEMLATISSVTGTLKMFLAGIAAISLIVGGIGIMNIMLVSVSERTREIGIRRSIGALNADIIVQFLTEAVVLTFL